MSTRLARRRLLQSAAMLPLLATPAAAWAQAAATRWDRTLILIELKGGNDGLNTVVPYADPLYASLRGPVALARERIVQLDERVGLHPGLAPLMEPWSAKELAVVQGVGYPFPNRSHFRSSEIWDTASGATRTLTDGWLAQAFAEQRRPPGAELDAVVVDLNALPAMGPGLRTVVLSDAESFIEQSRRMRDHGDETAAANPAMAHLLGVQRLVHAASEGLAQRLKEAPAPAHAYPATLGVFGRQLDLATKVILGRMPVVAVKIALPGFDTHARQNDLHDRLMAILGEGLGLLRKNLIAAGAWERTLTMTYSEFGRRVTPNASNGTDHGTAAPQLLMGARVKGGLHGEQPALGDLADGDLRYAVDYRSLYSAVARQWWGVQNDFGLRRVDRLDLAA